MKTRILQVLVLTAMWVIPATAVEDAPTWWERLEIDVHGFVDARGGTRLQDDLHEDDASLGEARMQLDLSRMGDLSTIQLRADLLYDAIVGESAPDLEEGTGFMDLREANVAFTPLDIMDVKIGRQILTWGSGDLLFVNDLFPKDWQSFFAGRDEEYLKAPSDAAFVSLYPSFAGINVAYTPRFDSDRYISGERLSYWNPLLGRRVGEDAVVAADKPDDWFEDGEVAARVSRNVAGYELALYGYLGFWKSPVGMDMMTTNAIFPELAVYGASVQGPLGGGLVKMEAGYYDSRDDMPGTDPMLPNSEIRALAGYEHEIGRDFTAAVQYYIELMRDYDEYLATLPAGMTARDEDRHVTTLRLTKQLMNQNLLLSLFIYYSPSDNDGYLRPYAKYKVTDEWSVFGGGNVFTGEDDHTFFAQFEKNSNAYAGARYSF